ITYTHVRIHANQGAQKPQESLQSHGSLGVSQTAYLRCSDTRIIRFALPMRNKFMRSPACCKNSIA
ncbi:hypothetical protein, partial [Bifidobacterium longum]|uniref:hypothetical protein n=1 Tax=Bifidobacterium longum TaxID=216816 RepID=UPI001A9558C9